MSIFNKIGYGDSASLDAFSRVRVSEPTTLFDSKFRYDTLPIRFNSITANSGTITHLPNESSVSLATAAVASSSAIIQSRQYHKYIPGKSQLILMTGVVRAAVAGIVKRIGYFDAEDGIFLEQNGTTDVAIVRRTSVSGSAVDNRVVQASWNIDKFDGTGVSGKTLDLTKSQILVIDLQWLGMGRVRIGFDIDGIIYYAHQFLNANTTLTTVYMKKSDLPVRWEIAGNGVATMQATCSAVISEGGSEADEGLLFSTDTGVTSRTVTAGTPLPVIAVRPATTFNSITNRVNFRLESASWIPTSGTNAFKWEIIYNPTITGGAWNSVNASSSAEVNITATSVSGGIVVASGFDNATSANRQLEFVNGISSRYPWCHDGAGNQIPFAIVFTEFAGNSDISASMQWRELR